MAQTRLLTLPFRAYVGAAKLSLKITTRAVKLATDAVGLTGADHDRSPSATERRDGAGGVTAERSRAAGTTPPPQPQTAQSTERRTSAVQPEPAPTPPPPPAAAPVPDPDTTPLTPLTRSEQDAKTIDDTPELVGEFGGNGAADSVGATLAVEPPWEGYERENAAAIVQRINATGAAEVAVLELYEQTHKRRQTVLNAAARRLKALSPPA